MGELRTDIRVGLENLATEDYHRYGWWLMVTGKCADLGSTWYALTAVPFIVEGNPLPALAYGGYGILGLVALNFMAIYILTIVVELGGGYVGDEGRITRELIPVLGYWLPGLWWLFVSYSNYKVVTAGQALF